MSGKIHISRLKDGRWKADGRGSEAAWIECYGDTLEDAVDQVEALMLMFRIEELEKIKVTLENTRKKLLEKRSKKCCCCEVIGPGLMPTATPNAREIESLQQQLEDVKAELNALLNRQGFTPNVIGSKTLDNRE